MLNQDINTNLEFFQIIQNNLGIDLMQEFQNCQISFQKCIGKYIYPWMKNSCQEDLILQNEQVSNGLKFGLMKGKMPLINNEFVFMKNFEIKFSGRITKFNQKIDNINQSQILNLSQEFTLNVSYINFLINDDQRIDEIILENSQPALYGIICNALIKDTKLPKQSLQESQFDCKENLEKLNLQSEKSQDIDNQKNLLNQQDLKEKFNYNIEIQQNNFQNQQEKDNNVKKQQPKKQKAIKKQQKNQKKQCKTQQQKKNQQQIKQFHNIDQIINKNDQNLQQKIELQNEQNFELVRSEIIELFDENIDIDQIIEAYEQFKNEKIQFKKYLESIQQEYLNIQSNQSLNINLPKINEKQKQLLKQKLQSNIPDKISQIILKTIWFELTNDIIQQYKNIYQKYGIITNNIEQVFDLEKIECLQLLRQQKEIDFKIIGNKLMIHQNIVELIYKNYIMKISEQQEMIDFISTVTNIEKKNIPQMIFKDNQELKNKIQDLYISNNDHYEKIKKLIQKHKESLNIIDNDIEQFYDYIKNNDDINSNLILRNILDQNPKLYYKMIQNINRYQTRIYKKVQNFTILQSYQNDLITILAKIFYINDQQKSKEAINKLIAYEQRQIYNNIPNNIKIELLYIQKQNNIQKFNDYLKSKNIQHIQQIDYQYVKLYAIINDQIQMLQNKLQINQFIDLDQLMAIANTLKIYLIVHQSFDHNIFTTFGNQNSQEIHIQMNIKNQNFEIILQDEIKIQDLKYKTIQEFPQNLKKISDNFPDWVKIFYGFESFDIFIQTKNQNQIKNCLKILINFSKILMLYQSNTNNSNNKNSLIEITQQLEESYPNLLNEWINRNRDSQFGQFIIIYQQIQARTNIECLLQEQRKIFKIFPFINQKYNLQDFNIITQRIKKDEIKDKIEQNKNNSNKFINLIINQLFGLFNRKESLKSFVGILNGFNLGIDISQRFLISYVLQSSELNLKARLIHYLSQYFSVPLIMQCQQSFERMEYKLKYSEEIVFEMLEGVGIFSFGIGSLAIQPMGKSKILNDILFPSVESIHQAFETQDKNIFSNSQVDCFFEKCFEKKHGYVLMDGQGNLTDQAIKSTLILSNFVLIHFHYNNLNERKDTDLLQKYIQIIKQHDKNIIICLIIRDAFNSQILKNQQTDLLSKQYPQLNIEFNLIDKCINLQNMCNMNKSERLNILRNLTLIFYQTIRDSKQDIKFTKQNFLQNFINNKNDDVQIIKEIVQKADEFIKSVDQIKNDIFQDKGIKMLRIKDKIRQKILELRNNCEIQSEDSQQLIIEQRLQSELEQLKNQLKNSTESNIMSEFYHIMTDQNSTILKFEISKKLKQLTQQNTQESNLKKTKLIEQNKDFIKEIKNNLNTNYYNNQNQQNQNEKDQKVNMHKQYIDKIDQLNEEIYMKSISYEYFWRGFVSLLTENDNCKYWKNKQTQRQIKESVMNQMKDGDCFELIDGRNLEFKADFLREIIEGQSSHKVIVVCVIGSQSTGKSTLMNFSFGTQFAASTGRCTQGVYFTLQKIPQNKENKAEWMLLLDTEGLQSPERLNDEYDRKIVMFALLCSDILIINSKGDINSGMTNILKMCALNYDKLKNYSKPPQILYTFVQNDYKDINPFKQQVFDLKTQVKQAGINSKSIDQTAEQLLGYDDDKIRVLGNAFRTDLIEQDKEINLLEGNQLKICQTNFGVEASEVYKIVQKCLTGHLAKDRTFKEIGLWLNDSKQNWDLIDRYAADILAFSNIEDFINDSKISQKLHTLWYEYLESKNVQQNDEMSINKQAMELFQLYKSRKTYDLDILKQKYFENNDTQKDQDLIIEIEEKFLIWRDLPSQKGIKIEQQNKNIKIIKVKFEVLKNQFRVALDGKLKEQQMLYVNKVGLKNISVEANRLSRDKNFSSLCEQDKQIESTQIFDKLWDKSIKDLNDQAQLERIKLSYYNDLYGVFYSVNNLISSHSIFKFNDLNTLFNNQNQNNVQIPIQNNFDNAQLYQYILDKLKNDNKQETNDFILDKDMLSMMSQDPADRIFDKNNSEQYLKLKKIINVNYDYKFISDQQNNLNKNALFSELLSILKKQKQIQIIDNKKNYCNQQYQDISWKNIDDENFIIQNLNKIFISLDNAGFCFQTNGIFGFYKKLESLQKYPIKDAYKKFKNDDYKKKQWIQDFVDNQLMFQQRQYQKIDQDIQNLFTFESFKILNQKDPFADIQEHKKELKFSNLNTFQSKDINYIMSEYAQKQRHSIENINLFINPQQSDLPQDRKQKILAQIAHKQIDWKLILDNIIKYVDETINKNQNEALLSSQQQDSDDIINLQMIMKINQINYQQAEEIQSVYIQNKIIEKIEKELHQKMALHLSHELKGRFTWCAMIISWYRLYTSVKQQFDNHIQEFQKQKSKFQYSFKNILSGQNQKQTKDGVKTMYHESFQIFDQKLLYVQKDNINTYLNQDKIKSIFDTKKVYQTLDNFYINMTTTQNVNFIEYVENPVKYFQSYVYKLKQDIIISYINDDIVQDYKSCIRKNILSIKSRLEMINDIIQKQPKIWEDIQDQYQIFVKNKEIKQFVAKQKFMKYMSPLFLRIFKLLLDGKFTYEIMIFKLKKQDQNILSVELRPLIDHHDQLKEAIDLDFKNHYYDKEDNKLLDILLKWCEDNENEILNQFFDIKTIVEELLILLKDEIQKIDQNRINSDSLNCQVRIDQFVSQAIGCQSCCPFCNRKCELRQQHGNINHSCKSVGHQLRVFANGYFKGIDGKYPSLRTCDNINPNSVIIINDQKFIWSNVVTTKMIGWQCDYQPQDIKVQQLGINFQNFWDKLGKQYCIDKGYKYIKKDDDIDQNNQLRDKIIVCLCLDESGSMIGQPWIDACKSSKELINYLKLNHQYPNKVKLIIYFYSTNCRKVIDQSLSDVVPESTWKYGDGSTNFDFPIQMSMNYIDQLVKDYSQVMWFFFTDGQANYPQNSLNLLRNFTQQNRQNWQNNGELKLKTFLITNQLQSSILEKMRSEFNDISKKFLGKNESILFTNIPFDKLGQTMIECFDNK